MIALRRVRPQGLTAAYRFSAARFDFDAGKRRDLLERTAIEREVFRDICTNTPWFDTSIHSDERALLHDRQKSWWFRRAAHRPL